MSFKIFTLFCLIGSIASLNDENRRKFPENFSFGVATSAYQIEGSWNVSDKGESIWDRFTHTTNGISDLSNGDVACDSYNQHKRDVEMLSELGVDFYRFSLSWTRILPNGFSNKISSSGLNYYNDLINDLLAANITPFVTIYHWDLPQNLQNLGGWTNPSMIDYFLDYVNVIFQVFGDRVKNWITFNEPLLICMFGYADYLAPALNMSGIADYKCAHTLLKSHAKAYHLYDKVYRSSQKGRISIAIAENWYESNSNSTADLEATNTAIQFNVGIFSHPIYSKEGDFPTVVKGKIKEKSIAQGFSASRLPEFSQYDIDMIKDTYDFFGLNHYTTFKIKHQNNSTDSNHPSFIDDMNVIQFHDSSWPSSNSEYFKVVPWGFRKTLNWVKDNYDNPEIIVFENGYSDKNKLIDNDRINYFKLYLNALIDSIEDGCNITGYTVWSLMDNFEWNNGYSQRFGLYYVDFEDKKRNRTPKSSAIYYANTIKMKSVEKI